MNSDSHWLWHALIWGVVLWYSTITIWVAIRGARDIRDMVKRLDEEPPPPPES
ncbi:MAG TPA: hypothetical protein PLB55_05480 [Prosthecobacter sp.]|jgi:hypothetical protein|nr:hypothetical protein [Prosthecobacter sp.]